MYNNLIKEDMKLTKEQLIFLQKSVKKLMDNGNQELASIMARNISKYLNIDENKKVLKKL